MGNVLYTDGGCVQRSRTGAYCFLIVYIPEDKILSENKHGTLLHGESQGHLDCTNNIMEMQAVYEGLKSCRNITLNAIVTDSQYVQKGLLVWHYNWKKQNWNGNAGPVKNKDLWLKLIEQWYPHKEKGTEIIHIRGHQGVYWNEVCDRECTRCIKML